MALPLAPTSPAPLSIEVTGPIGTLWLNRPDKRNAISLEMWAELPQLIGELEANDAVRVIVIRGAGDHFCAGADISTIGAQLTDGDGPGSYRRINEVAEETIAAATKPTIAMISGFCVGGGCQISFACDLRIADTTARFGITVAKLGFTYPSFALERAARLMGSARTKYLLYSGDIVDAQTGYDWGITERLYEPGALSAEVEALAEMMAQRSLLTIIGTKEMLASFDASSTIDDDVTATWEHEAKHGPDIIAGVEAFTSKSTPTFTWLGKGR